MSAIVFDIETGALPWEEVEKFYEPPAGLAPWNDDMVRYGVTKDVTKKKEKYDQVRADYETKLARQAADNEAHRLEWLSRGALSPLTGRVLAVGLRSERGTAILGGDGEEEWKVLTDFWLSYMSARAASRRMVGFNIFGFDLPFLIRRSWFHGVAVPESLLEKGRYWSPVFCDLMQVWGCGNYGERVSLDTAARYFGVGQKPDGVTGADFGRLWAGPPEDRQKALAYLTNDLDMTWQIAERLGVAP